ncbi:MAG TPA: autotransporter-associated beta strand repeat-containing protein, partial [Cyclobacteriaceae bacterium]
MWSLFRVQKLFLLFFFLLVSHVSWSQTWLPITGGSWATPSNWSTNSVPAPGATVIIPFDQSAPIIDVPTQSIANLTVNGSVIFDRNAGPAATITITSSLSIASGKTLAIGDGSNNGAIDLTLASGSISSIDGILTLDSGPANIIMLANGTLAIPSTGLINEGTNFSDFLLGAAATLEIGVTSGISASGTSGAIQIQGSRSFSTAANYTYNGTASQITGTGLPVNVSNLTLNNPADVTLTNSVIITNALTVSDGSLILGNSNVSTGSVSMTGSTLTSGGTGFLTLGGPVTFNASGSQAEISADISLGGANRIFNANSAGGSLISGQITGANGIEKSGTNALTLSGNNTYSGSTTVSSGTLNINSATAIGTGTLILAGGSIDNTSGGSITISNNNAQNWNSDFAFIGTNDLNLGTGAVTPSASRQVTVNAGNLTVGGIIGGGGVEITKAGSGTLTLTGVNTFSGGTTLNTGTLNINNANALGTAAGTFTINGGTIDNTSGGTITTDNHPISIGGDFTFTGTNNLNLGSGNVSFTSNSQVTVNAATLSIGGVVSASSFDLTKGGSGVLSFGSNPVTLDALTISGGTLLSTSGNLTIGGDFNNSGTFSHNNGTVIFNSALAQSVASVNYNNLTLTGAGSKNASGAIVVGLTLDNSSVFDLGSNTLSPGTITNSGTLRFSGSSNGLAVISGTVEYYGSSQIVTSGAYNNLHINQSSGEALLGGATTVNGVLTLDSRLNIDGVDLTLASSASITVTPDASKMIIATGGSQVIKQGLNGSFTFPIGDNTGTYEYSPITVNVTSGSSDVGVSVTDAKHPNNASSTDFITRYWEVSSSVPATADISAQYPSADV